ncbi:hypothetical protein [Lysobacter sp. F60174L2]|uniref:hypothetical protein n=1 Tax=Lysobacter sp. F60174L2 TaxID=3459295 RepID=UPI00403DF0A5
MKLLARFVSALATGLLLAGCTPGVEAEIDDACGEIPFAAALPSLEAIGSRPLLWKQCGVVEVSARYGQEDPETGDGDHCTININDTRFQTPDGAASVGADDAFEHGKSLMLGFSKMNVEMLVGARKGYLEEPVLLNARGGPSTLPVVGQLSNGDTYAIPVPAKQEEPGSESLLAVINDRYALTIQCTEPVLDHDQADAMYRPYINALQLGNLP